MNKIIYHKACTKCQGRGKIKLTIGKRARRRFIRQMSYFDQKIDGVTKPKPLVPHVDMCQDCNGHGIVPSESFPEVNEDYPHVAIIGGGIGGVAFAVACLHRGIPFTLYERDLSFKARSQGYGLTLQQASKAMGGLGIYSFKEGLISIIHKVHNPSGKIIGEWGRRKLSEEELKKRTKPRNIHISRQSLRKKLLDGLQDERGIKWGYCLKNISHSSKSEIELEFLVDGKIKTVQADLVVGADGIHSCVRHLFIGEEKSPLQYLGCIVILGICPLEAVGDIRSELLDSQTVFQTVNGHERIYMMPYDKDTIMWQLSFPMSEKEAKILSRKGPEALKREGIRRLGDWHTPIPEILNATKASLISGYPVYDREVLQAEFLKDFGNITLLGDAMHPMSPFKGQGANQAILDALDLARDITAKCHPDSKWREQGLRKILLQDFEKQMIERSAPKVIDSANQAKLLHSDAVLHDGDTPRSRGI